MFGKGICEKYQSRDEKFPEPNGSSLKTGMFRKYPSQAWYIGLITPNYI